MSTTSSEATGPGKRAKTGGRRLPREQRRESILDGATHAFARSGFAATRMPEIAKAAGITPIIVYRHFDSKQELYRATLKRVCSRLTVAFETGSESLGFGIGTRSFLEAARQDPDGFRLLWRHAAREPLFSNYAAELREWAVGVAQNSMHDRVPYDALQWAAHAVVGYLVEAVLNWLEFGDSDRDALFVKATNAAMRAGVRAWSKTRQEKTQIGKP